LLWAVTQQLLPKCTDQPTSQFRRGKLIAVAEDKEKQLILRHPNDRRRKDTIPAGMRVDMSLASLQHAHKPAIPIEDSVVSWNLWRENFASHLGCDVFTIFKASVPCVHVLERRLHPTVALQIPPGVVQLGEPIADQWLNCALGVPACKQSGISSLV